MRKFEELITEIEHDEERFVPIEVIAKLATYNATVKIIKAKVKNIYNLSYIKVSVKYECGMIEVIEIESDLSVNVFHKDRMIRTFNQVQIVKNLIKWGFVEP